MQLALRRDGSSGHLKEKPVVFIGRHRSKGVVALLQVEQRQQLNDFLRRAVSGHGMRSARPRTISILAVRCPNALFGFQARAA